MRSIQPPIPRRHRASAPRSLGPSPAPSRFPSPALGQSRLASVQPARLRPIQIFILGLLWTLGAANTPAASTHDVAASACLPAVSDHTSLWWANGWLDGAPREPALLCLQAGHLAAVFDPARAGLVRLGTLRRPGSYESTASEPPTRADDIMKLPEASLGLWVLSGTNRFHCVQAATNRKDWMNFPVRIIESGRFVQRFDILQLAFENDRGERLEAEGRLEVIAWPDRLHCLLEITPTVSLESNAAPVLEPGLELIADRSWNVLTKPPSRSSLNTTGRVPTAAVGIAILPTQRGRTFAVDADPDDPGLHLRGEDLQTGAALNASFDATRGWHRIELPARRWSVAEEPDRLERFRVMLTNDSPHEQVVRLLFDDPSGTPGITGVTPMLRDVLGYPTGIPVQTSKNWHRQTDRRMLYEGPWLHAFTLLRLPPRSRTEAEFALTWARWGGVPAASHAQLCLIGWGWNQLWDQAAIGSWGESICYEPDAIQQRCRIDDVRPLMVWGMGEGRRQWTWTHNVGGGDFLVYLDAEGRYQPWRAVRTAYLSQGPNLTDVRYSGVTADGAIACRVAVSSPRTDDLNRTYHHLQYEVLKPTPFRRLAFYQVGSDRYHWHQYGRLARGNTDGLIEEWEPVRGGRSYSRTGIPCPGEAPWFSLHAAIPADGGKPVAGAWAARGLIVRSWKARLGGHPTPPFASVYGTEAGRVPSANLELSPPPDVAELLPGDFVDAELELVILPISAEDYYGPNAGLRNALTESGNTWQGVHRQASGNRLGISMHRGRLTGEYPPVIAVDRRGIADLEIEGGLGYLPVTFTGLKAPRGWRLERDNGTGFHTVDQSVHGQDFWQSTHDSAKGTWRLTFNLPMDALPSRGPTRLRLRPGGIPDPRGSSETP